MAGRGRPFTSAQVAALNFRHGHSVRGHISPEYQAYKTAKKRCENRHQRQFKNYGGRGIKFLFRSFHNFLACLGLKPSRKHHLDRIDNNGHYEPGNVRWATVSESMKNRRMTKKRLAACRRNFVLARKHVKHDPLTGRFTSKVITYNRH